MQSINQYIRKVCRYILGLIVLIGPSFLIQAQPYVPLNHTISWKYEYEHILKDEYNISSFKPFYVAGYTPDSLVTDSILSYAPKGLKNWFQRKLFSEHFARIKEGPLALVIDPLVILSVGNENHQSDPLYRNTRGVKLEGMLGPKVYFTSSFYENQARFPSYINQWAGENMVVPGQGTVRYFGNGGYDFNWAEGIISYKPTKNWLFEMGHGKKFIGNGYRSLLLSDNAFNYPYILVGYSTRWFHFYKMHASLMHDIFYVNRSNAMYSRKTASMHYFGITPIHNFEISFFQGTIWETPDSTGRFDFNAEMLSPFPVDFNDKQKNMLAGYNLSYTLFKNYQFYHQMVFDDFKLNRSTHTKKRGFQAGMKLFEPASIKGLLLIAEVNQVLPYVYSQRNPELSFTHYNQPLAHPLGANFREWVFLGNYNWKRLQVLVKTNFAKYGLDNENEHWGKDIFKSLDNASEYPVNSTADLFQGLTTVSTIMHGRFSYVINPKTNLLFSIGYQKRVIHNDAENNSNSGYFYVSLHSNLNNFYYDF